MNSPPKLSQEAISALKPPAPEGSEWVLARARCISAGIRLVLCEIDQIGISVREGFMSPDQAAAELAAIESLPVYVGLGWNRQVG